MLTTRAASERGHFDHGWLRTYHTFSFSEYFDPEHMGFRTLRVINEDWVLPKEGFGTHPHKDMEILTYVVSGALEHRDSMGNGSVIRPGEVQRMSAGTGVTHSEFNPSGSEEVHLLQIWILPSEKGLEPSYEQTMFSAEDRRNHLCLIASRDGRSGSVTIHQDACMYASLLDKGVSIEHRGTPGRYAWMQVVQGQVDVNGVVLAPGDGLAAHSEERLALRAIEDAEFLLFDLG